MEIEQLYEVSSDIELLEFSGTDYLIYNTRFHKYTKINDKYYNLLILADGTRDLNQLKEEYYFRYQMNLEVNQIQKLLLNLEKLGVFGQNDQIEPTSSMPSYIKHGFIFIKSSVVSAIVPVFHFLFKRVSFFVFIALTAFYLLTIFLYPPDQYSSQNFETVFPLTIFFMFISTILHELGHSAAAHYYKARHGGVGFGFYLHILPVFFADVTDVWRLSKWKRIVVNSAGIYFEIIFCMILSLIGHIANIPFLMVTSVVIFIAAIYNFIPFMRADGYWILSDLMNKPNLNFHAANNLKKAVSALVRFTLPDLGKKDYWVTLYGLFNMGVISFVIYFQVFKNWSYFINFPLQLVKKIIGLFRGEIVLNFKEVFHDIIMIVLYIVILKLITSILKFVLNKLYRLIGL